MNQQMQDQLIAAVRVVGAAFSDQELAVCVLGLVKLRWKHGAAQEALLAAVGERAVAGIPHLLPSTSQ